MTSCTASRATLPVCMCAPPRGTWMTTRSGACAPLCKNSDTNARINTTATHKRLAPSRMLWAAHLERCARASSTGSSLEHLSFLAARVRTLKRRNLCNSAFYSRGWKRPSPTYDLQDENHRLIIVRSCLGLLGRQIVARVDALAP